MASLVLKYQLREPSSHIVKITTNPSTKSTHLTKTHNQSTNPTTTISINIQIISSKASTTPRKIYKDSAIRIRNSHSPQLQQHLKSLAMNAKSMIRRRTKMKRTNRITRWSLLANLRFRILSGRAQRLSYRICSGRSARGKTTTWLWRRLLKRCSKFLPGDMALLFFVAVLLLYNMIK